MKSVTEAAYAAAEALKGLANVIREEGFAANRKGRTAMFESHLMLARTAEEAAVVWRKVGDQNDTGKTGQ